MKHLNPTEAIAHRQKHPRKEIRYWEVHIRTNWIGESQAIDIHESRAILQSKYGTGFGITYRAIR